MSKTTAAETRATGGRCSSRQVAGVGDAWLPAGDYAGATGNEVMNDHAPEYTRRERIVLAAKLGVALLLVYLLAQFWLLERISGYVEIANCLRYGDLNGMQLLLYGIFVISPLSLAALILALEGRRCIRVLRIGQNPLPGAKVLRKTRFKYGNAARVQPTLLFAVLLVLAGFALWGSFQVEKINRMIPPCSSEQLLELEKSDD
ncbi:MAG: hypothetical protein OEN02_18890 [Gammaproteobacteria bacterium]|nr:hypothetical protein [Gammaproteobacteria bacterium]